MAKGRSSAAELIAGECLGGRMRILNRAVTALYDEALRPHGLRVGQMTLLAAVAQTGTEKPANLCRILSMEKSTLSRDVELMKPQRLARGGRRLGRPAGPPVGRLRQKAWPSLNRSSPPGDGARSGPRSCWGPRPAPPCGGRSMEFGRMPARSPFEGPDAHPAGLPAFERCRSRLERSPLNNPRRGTRPLVCRNRAPTIISELEDGTSGLMWFGTHAVLFDRFATISRKHP